MLALLLITTSSWLGAHESQVLSKVLNRCPMECLVLSPWEEETRLRKAEQLLRGLTGGNDSQQQKWSPHTMYLIVLLEHLPSLGIIWDQRWGVGFQRECGCHLNHLLCSPSGILSRVTAVGATFL